MLPPLPPAPPPLPLPPARAPIPRNDGMAVNQAGDKVRIDLFGEVFHGDNSSHGAGRVSAMITAAEALGLSRQLAALAVRLQGA